MQRKLLYTYIILIVVGIGITGITSILIYERDYKLQIEERLLSNCKVVEKVILDFYKEDKELNFQLLANEYSEYIDARITIIDIEGNVIVDSSENYIHMERHDNRPEFIEAIEVGYGKSIRFSNTLQLDFMYVAIPFYMENEIVSVIRLALPLDRINIIVRNMWGSMTLAVLFALIITFLMSYRYTKNVTQPIKELRDVSNTIAKGNFEKRIIVNTKDEIGELAETFNHMAYRLKLTIGELEEKSVNLEAILNSMINGIIAVDSEDKIIMINPTAYELMNIEADASGKHLIEVVRDDRIVDIIDRTLKQGVFCSEEILFGKKYLKIHVTPVKNENNTNIVIGAVTVIQDITQIKKLAQVRKDFVANVSHELKTPLTTIKGFVETLMAGSIDDGEVLKRFLEIIDIEVERLSRLIEDVLVLSELEGKQRNKNNYKTDICKAIKEVLSMLSEQADKKNIQLSYQCSEDNININANKDQVKQMILNLVDNGIKYTPNNGRVHLSIERDKNRIIIRVKDTGIGIPQQHLSRIFERFYRVDKGRSRDLGGTGLGLAIVKHIILSMKGNIDVKSKEGKGTEFIISLPV